MNKLMIAAAVAALAGASYAGLCSPEDPDPVTPAGEPAPLVYDWTFKGKTTIGTPSTTKSVIATDCTEEDVCGVGTETTSLIKRIPANFAMAGWTAICECGKLIGDYDSWDGYSFWITKPYKSYFSAANCGQYGMKACCEEAFIHVIGKKELDAEIFSGFYGPSTFVNTSYGQTWTFDYAGLGKYVQKNPIAGSNWCGYYSKFSGSFAGFATASYYINLAKNLCSPSVVFDCADCLADEIVDQPTVVYGTWSVKYNASKTRKYITNRGSAAKAMTPAWASFDLN